MITGTGKSAIFESLQDMAIFELNGGWKQVLPLIKLR
jgi:hypothetical protein